MFTALIIVGGLVIISVVAVVGDAITKGRQIKGQANSVEVQELRKRVEALEAQAAERDQRLAQLETDLSFTTKLLGEK
jgi:hypothetical protein